MKTHHYVAIFLRCASLGLLIFGIGELPKILHFIYDPSGLRKALSLVILLFPFLASGLFWFFPITISKMLVPTECDKNIEPISLTSLSSIFISAIGIYLLVSALPDALYWLAIFNSGSSLENLEYSSDNKANAMAAALEIVLAIFLILKSNTIAAFIKNK